MEVLQGLDGQNPEASSYSRTGCICLVIGVNVSEAIEKRRARRALSETPIEKEKVDALVRAARLSASCFNNQPWRITVCMGDALPSLKKSLSKGNAWATKAPLIFAVAARAMDDCRSSDNRDYFLFSTGLAIGQMLLEATELDLIAHPIAGYDPLKVKADLGIPQDCTVITLVICAYPSSDNSLLSDKQKASEPVRPERKPIGENFFLNRWGTPYQ